VKVVKGHEKRAVDVLVDVVDDHSGKMAGIRLTSDAL
jgi:hypothetical protein